MTNNVDSDQQAEPTDLDLHYLKHGLARQIQGNLQFLKTRHILFETKRKIYMHVNYFMREPD